MKIGAELLPARALCDEVLLERSRQIGEGYTGLHDQATHPFGTLAMMAATFAIPAADREAIVAGHRVVFDYIWPFTPEEFTTTDRRRELVIAAALIFAEIERLDRDAEATAARVSKQ